MIGKILGFWLVNWPHDMKLCCELPSIHLSQSYINLSESYTNLQVFLYLPAAL